ncbi:MAG: Nif3-like dinuclear metal center hexameric protein [Deltaproteobacteria bacterium]
MSSKCGNIIQYMEQVAPGKLSQNWDNTGLLIGDAEQKVKKVLVSLDVTPDIADEAIAIGADMIVAHHPLIFKPLNNIRRDNPLGKLLYRLIQHNVNVFCAHTNLDSAGGGVNHTLAEMFELKDVQVLEASYNEGYKKIAVFVPVEYVDRVREAVAAAGAGWLGNYSDCSFMAQGIGTFKPLEGSNPVKGSIGELEKVEEFKLEAIVPEDKVDKVIEAMIEAHPYEEVAYDVYNIENKNAEYGFARMGKLQEKIDLVSLAAIAKKTLGIKKVRFIGDANKIVENVIVSSGAYYDIARIAKMKGADVIITGDLKYHDARKILDYGLCAIDAGHFGTENVIVPVIANYLSQMAEDVQVVTSTRSKDVFMVL